MQVARRDQPLHLAFHPLPGPRGQLAGVRQAGHRQDRQPGAGPGLPQHPVQQAAAGGGAGVPDGHPDDVLPLVVLGVDGQHAQVLVLDGGPRGQEVLERPVDEVHRIGGELAEQSAAVDQVVEQLLRLGADAPQRGQGVLDDVQRLLVGHLRGVVPDQPVGEALEQLDRVRGQQPQVGRRPYPALVVAPLQQQVQRGGVQLHPAVRQVSAPVPVEGADQRAQQRVGGQPGQVPVAGDGGGELVPPDGQVRVVGVAAGGGPVPAGDELDDVRRGHRQQFQVAEALVGQPVGLHRGGAGGDHEPAPGEGGEQPDEPLPRLDPLLLRDLVDPVHQQQQPPVQQLPGDPAAGLVPSGQGGYGIGEEVLGLRHGDVRGDRPQPDEQRDQAVEVGQRGRQGAPGDAGRQPLEQCGLAGSGVSPDQYPVASGQCLLGAAGDRALAAVDQFQAEVAGVQRPGLLVPAA